MTRADDRILETLDDSGLALSPAVIAYNIGFSRSYVNSRISKLRKHGLINRVDQGYYEITDEGVAYLDGSIDIETIETEE